MLQRLFGFLRYGRLHIVQRASVSASAHTSSLLSPTQRRVLLRSKTCTFLPTLLSLVNVLKKILLNSGWHMYLLYMGLCIISFVIVYVFVKETKDLPMEELAALFGDEVVVHITKDGMAISEDPDLDKVRSMQLEEVQAYETSKAKPEVTNETGFSHHTELVEG